MGISSAVGKIVKGAAGWHGKSAGEAVGTTQLPFLLLALLSLDGKEMKSVLFYGGISHLTCFPQSKITNHYYTSSCNFAHGKKKSCKGTIFKDLQMLVA